MDITGAFDNTKFYSIRDASVKKGVDPITCEWIGVMLSKREATTSLGEEDLVFNVTRGCPQGDFSPLLWSLLVDELIEKLNKESFYTQGYA